MAFIRSLADQPHFTGDYTDTDEGQRIRQIKIVGHYAITYWADHAATTIMVVDVRPVNR